MKVDLAAPFQGHAPDETVDLPERTARELVSNGLARLTPVVEEWPNASWTKDRIIEWASAHSVELTGTTKAQYLTGIGEQTRAPNPAGNGEPEGATP